MHDAAKMCFEAPLAIVPCIDESLAIYGDVCIQDLSAATENILLAARALGLGAVWVGIYHKKERVNNLQKILNLPAQIKPFSVIPIGYTNVQQKFIERFKAERVHYNSW